MPLRYLLRYFANNEKLVQRLSESYPVRRAAQLVIAIFYKGSEKISQVDHKDVSKFLAFLRKFKENVKEGIQDAKKQLKK